MAQRRQQLRTVIYTRISHDKDGAAVGVERQEQACRELAERQDWQVVGVYTDNDISAFNGKTRPDFETMLRSMAAGEFDALVVWHVDRLYRTLKDLSRLIEIAQGRDLQIRTVNAGDLDLGTASGRMLATILGSVAAHESEHKGERQRLANAKRAEAGVWRKQGPRLFGWTQDGQQLEPEASAVRQAVQDVLAGRSLRAIAAQWNEKGLRTPRLTKRGGNPWTNLTLRRVLINPTHAGLRTYSERQVVDGKVTYESKIVGPGDWEPIIDPDTHRGLDALLGRKGRSNNISFERKHMGSGVYRCGVCKGPLYAAYTHRGRMIYRCRDLHVGRAGEPLDALVEGVVLRLLSDPRVGARLASRQGADGVVPAALHAKRNALVAQRDELATMFTDGVLDGPAVRRESEKLQERIAGIDATLAQAVRVSAAAALLADGPGRVKRHWDDASPDIRGKVIDELMAVKVNTTVRGRKTFDPDSVDIRPKP
jgi:site-specific DNA recombinase